MSTKAFFYVLALVCLISSCANVVDPDDTKTIPEKFSTNLNSNITSLPEIKLYNLFDSSLSVGLEHSSDTPENSHPEVTAQVNRPTPTPEQTLGDLSLSRTNFLRRLITPMALYNLNLIDSPPTRALSFNDFLIFPLGNLPTHEVEALSDLKNNLDIIILNNSAKFNARFNLKAYSSIPTTITDISFTPVLINLEGNEPLTNPITLRSPLGKIQLDINPSSNSQETSFLNPITINQRNFNPAKILDFLRDNSMPALLLNDFNFTSNKSTYSYLETFNNLNTSLATLIISTPKDFKTFYVPENLSPQEALNFLNIKAIITNDEIQSLDNFKNSLTLPLDLTSYSPFESELGLWVTLSSSTKTQSGEMMILHYLTLKDIAENLAETRIVSTVLQTNEVLKIKNLYVNDNYLITLYPKRKSLTKTTRDITRNCRIKTCKEVLNFEKLYCPRGSTERYEDHICPTIIEAPSYQDEAAPIFLSSSELSTILTTNITLPKTYTHFDSHITFNLKITKENLNVNREIIFKLNPTLAPATTYNVLSASPPIRGEIISLDNRPEIQTPQNLDQFDIEIKRIGLPR